MINFTHAMLHGIERRKAKRAQKRDLLQAINQMNMMDDRELWDLGLSRASITDAVVNGRPGIERDTHDLAA